MAFWEVVGKIVSEILEEGARKQAEIQKRIGREIEVYERKLRNAELSHRMNDPEFAARVSKARQNLQEVKQKVYGVSGAYNGVIGGKTIEEWERQWRGLGVLSSLTLEDLSPYNHAIGLYKAEMGGKIRYIGRAIEYNNGGFRKRLRDYVRDSNSARTHKSGGKMHAYADNLYISILVMGNSEKDVEAVKALEAALIMKYRPEWNVQFNRF